MRGSAGGPGGSGGPRFLKKTHKTRTATGQAIAREVADIVFILIKGKADMTGEIF
jgi:hypothetical protein